MEITNNVLLKNVASGHVITISKSPFKIGRALASDYIIENKIISRIHCTFTKADEGWTITDSSTNGTFVNETHIKGTTSAPLKDDDEIYLGHEDYTYKFFTHPSTNAQVTKIKNEESHSSPSHVASNVSSPVSFDENGISDEQLNNLADNMLNTLESNNPESLVVPVEEPSEAGNHQSEENRSVENVIPEEPSAPENHEIEGNRPRENIIPEEPSALQNNPPILQQNEPETLVAPMSLPTSQSSGDTVIYSLPGPSETSPKPEADQATHASVPEQRQSRTIDDIINKYTDSDPSSSPSTLAKALTKVAEDSVSTLESPLQRPCTEKPVVTLVYNLDRPSTSTTSGQSVVVNSLTRVVALPSQNTSPTSPTTYAVSSISNSHKKLKIVKLPNSLLPQGGIRKLTPNELKELISAKKVASVINLEPKDIVAAGTSKESPVKLYQIISSNNVPPSTSSTSSCDHQILDSSAVPAAVQEVVIEDTAEKTTDAGEPGSSKANDDNKQSHFEEMEDELTCTICANMFIKAVTLGCSHSFCQYCIETWKKKKSECPICRAKITLTTRTLVLDNFIERMLKNASEEDKQVRKEAIEARRKSEEAEKNKNLANQGRNTSRRGRNRGGNQRTNTRNTGEAPPPPPPPVIVVADSPSPSESTSDLDSDNEDYDYDDYAEDDWYSSRSGAYYGGYGRCYNCGARGHWANGCPWR